MDVTMVDFVEGVVDCGKKIVGGTIEVGSEALKTVGSAVDAIAKKYGIDMRASKPDLYGKWKDGNTCGHAYGSLEVTELRWLEVQMFEEHTREIIDTLAGKVAGVHATHECIEVHYKCTECSSSGIFTTELVGFNGFLKIEGKQFKPGSYTVKQLKREEKGGFIQPHKPNGMKVDLVEKKFDTMSGQYNLVTFNCKHWAEQLWNKLV